MIDTLIIFILKIGSEEGKVQAGTYRLNELNSL